MMRCFAAVATLAALLAHGSGPAEGTANTCGAPSYGDDDGSSMLQLNGVLRAPLAVVTEEVQASSESGECPSVGVEAVFTNASLSYLVDLLSPFAYVDLNRSLVTVAPVEGVASGFDYSFKNIVIDSIAMESAAFNFVPQQGLEFHLANVAVSFTVEYQISSNSWWTVPWGTQTGLLAVSVGSSSFVSAMVVFESDNSTTHAIATLRGIDTELFIDQMNFQDGGMFGSFLTLVSSICAPLVQAFAQDAIKSQLNTFRMDLTDQFNARLAEVLDRSPLPFPLVNATGPDAYAVDMRICGIDAGEDHIAIRAYIGVNATGADPYDGRQGYDVNSTGARVSYAQMLGLTLTEWTISGLVWLSRRVSGTLGDKVDPKDVAMPKVPFKVTSDPDSRVRTVTKRGVISAVKHLRQGGLQDYGVEITDPSIRFFDLAVAIVANLKLDPRVLIDGIFASVARHVKLAGEAKEEMKAIKAFAASRSTAL